MHDRHFEQQLQPPDDLVIIAMNRFDSYCPPEYGEPLAG
jgi:hypothetical protein